MAYNIDFLEPIWWGEPPKKGSFASQSHYKGGSAPKPDPQIGAAALQSAQVGRDAFEFYKQEYINGKPAQDELNRVAIEVQQQLLDSSKKNDAYAEDYYNYMQETFRPLEKSIVKDAQEYDTAGRREAEASKGLSDVRQAFGSQREMSLREKERAGVNPNSGNALALGKQLDTAEAIAGADAMNKGRTNAEMRGKALKMDAASLGRNLPSNQATSQQIANSTATAGLNAGLSGAANQRAGLSVMGAGYDANMKGLNQSANILQNQYNSQLQAHQMNQASSDSQWANIGALVGVGAAMMMKDGGSVDEARAKTLAGLDSVQPVRTIDNETEEVFEGEGTVRGKGTETSDSIDAKLSDGEYVLNAGATKMIGLDALDALNERGLEFREEE